MARKSMPRQSTACDFSDPRPFQEFRMKTTSAMLAFVLAATTSSLWAQQPIPPATPIPPQTSQSVGDSLVKQVSFVNGLPLREAIRMLQAECPGFQAVIVPDPGCAEVN